MKSTVKKLISELQQTHAPKVKLEQVVLPEGQKQQLLSAVTNYERFKVGLNVCFERACLCLFALLLAFRPEMGSIYSICAVHSITLRMSGRRPCESEYEGFKPLGAYNLGSPFFMASLGPVRQTYTHARAHARTHTDWLFVN